MFSPDSIVLGIRTYKSPKPSVNLTLIVLPLRRFTSSMIKCSVLFGRISPDNICPLSNIFPVFVELFADIIYWESVWFFFEDLLCTMFMYN